ncbi:hypothetical protein N7481_000378 [Penicillium waksmanii]|uniref:uncharacterized protein n=1 Tax=Penicillium waksmanii TaxID=69791 RepID=UPI002546F8F2|nr:uncharacterized protein N7481_000378 [Penicillium waksmanii]KAJ5999969.1 hypothetical protein N7481_000378 [Penicillium waksmanii]
MPPPPKPSSSGPADLLDFGPMDVKPHSRSTNRTWSPGELGHYFLTDRFNIMFRIAEDTHTDISIVANSDPLQIRLAGLTPEDVDEALDKLQGSLGFIEPPNDIAVLGSNDEVPRYRMKKLMDTDRATGQRLVEDLSLKYNLKNVMIPYSQAPAIVTISPTPRVTTAPRHPTPPHAGAKAPTKWDSEFPKLDTPAQKISPQSSSAWPALSPPTSASRYPIRSPPPPARTTQPMQPSIAPQVKIPVVQQSEIGKLATPRIPNVRKTRKPASVTDENIAPRALSLSSPLTPAAIIKTRQERSPTPETTVSSLPSRESGLSSPLSSPPPPQTTPSSSPPTSPPTRYISRPGSPVSLSIVKRPEFNPGTRDRPAGIRFPGGLPCDATRPVAISASHAALQDSLEMVGNVPHPSSPIATPLVRRPTESLALTRQKLLFGLPISSIPERSSSKRPPVPPKPPQLRMTSSKLSTVIEAVPESPNLVDSNPMKDEPKPANLSLDGGEMTGKKYTTETVNSNDFPSFEMLFDLGEISVYIVDDQPIIPCIELPIFGLQGTVPTETMNTNPQEQAPDRKQESNVQAAMQFLCREIQINESTSLSEIAEAPQPRDPADDSIHEAQVAVSESETRELHSIMNQKSARPVDIDKESKIQARADSKARHTARKNDMWGLTTFQRARGHNNVAKAILEPTMEPGVGAKERLSSRNDTIKRSKSEDRAKTVFHMLEPVLGAAKAFPGRMTLEVQIGLILVPPTQPCGPMDLAELRKYFNPNTGLPPPKPFLYNRLAISKADIDNLIGLRVAGRRVFDQEPYEEAVDCEFHCVLPKGNTVESFLVTIFNDEPARTTGPNFPLGNIHLNFPDNNWDAAIVLTGQSPYVKLGANIKDDILEMTKNFRKVFSGSDIQIETTVPPPPFEIEKILMKRVSKYRYLREGEKDRKEDLYMRITEIQDLVISYSGFQKTDIKAYCPDESDKVERPHRWSEVSLISSGTEDALESNWKLEVGSQTSKWNTATLFGQGTAPASSSAASSPDALIDAPGLWSLFGLTETVVKNIDEIGSRSKDASAASTEGKISKSLVLSGTSSSKDRAAPSGQVSQVSQDRNKSLANVAGSSRLREHEENPRESRYW